jgi:hypothetical protein
LKATRSAKDTILLSSAAFDVPPLVFYPHLKASDAFQSSELFAVIILNVLSKDTITDNYEGSRRSPPPLVSSRTAAFVKQSRAAVPPRTLCDEEEARGILT